MNLHEWERDVINRQRNIVFPDTVLNQGRFYRNIASGKAVYTFGQRISLLGVVGFFIIVHVADFAGNLGGFLARDYARPPGWILWPSLYSLVWLLFWIFLAVKGLLPTPPVRKRRRGYRRSGRV